MFNGKKNALLIVSALTSMSLTFAAPAQILDFQIFLDGAQEVPSVDTEAMGMGTAMLDTGTNEFSWEITFMDLESPQTMAHFHGPAPICENAGIQITLPLGSPIVGSMMLTDQQAEDVINGLWYVNVHTEGNMPGEIRGQVVPTPLDDPIPPTILTGNIVVQLEPVADKLVAPNWGASPPGDSSRLMVSDQVGILWSIDLATNNRTMFLDVSDRLVNLGAFGPGSFDERGFLGFAFHPDYQDNGLLYTYTSEPVDGPADFSTLDPGMMANHQAVITEWQVPNPGDSASIVDPGSAREILRIDEPQFNHNGGAVSFGSDGMLYIAFGDGGAADDQAAGHSCRGNAQDLSNPLGAILRIDPRVGNTAGAGNSANGQYNIPADNPFVGMRDAVEEIYAYGLRNPFRFSFDQVTGGMYIADVGQNDVEEINFLPAGDLTGPNFGWNFKEGTFNFIPNGSASGYVTDRAQAMPDDLVDPISEYDHDEGISVIGGFVYHGRRITALRGRYLFGEFAQTFSSDGRLFYLDSADKPVELQLLSGDPVNLSVLGFGQDGNGEVYLMGNTTGVPFMETGVVVRIAPKLGDLTADGIVDGDDLLILLNQWNQPDSPADLNGDDDVDGLDLLIQLNGWG